MHIIISMIVIKEKLQVQHCCFIVIILNTIIFTLSSISNLIFI